METFWASLQDGALYKWKFLLLMYKLLCYKVGNFQRTRLLYKNDGINWLIQQILRLETVN